MVLGYYTSLCLYYFKKAYIKNLLSLAIAYGVHTSRKIPPNTWFRPLAIGLCDRSQNLSAARRNDERKSVL
ncbi:hypothetical protein [Nostoc sp. CmiVER01]|uniref:hypothetical protein n=1 Tax=Nostoc sp. CmiVER01 TaxID=3075384 RepID=UPI002AD5C60E|nr:hypothetical protein [Nostoc sp. CmiVER01]